MAIERLITGLTVNKLWKAHHGFTLYAPLGSKKARLVDMGGDSVNEWSLPNSPALYAELLPNTNLLLAGHVENGPLADMEGAGGVIVELDWEGKEVWRYEDPYLHHACCRLDNGNTLVLKWEKVADEQVEKIQGGFEGSERNGEMYADVIQEIDTSGKAVWEWKAVDHLDVEKDKICPLCERDEWSGGNAISVFADGSIMLSCRRTNTVCKIDKASGDIVWRWGAGEIGHQNGATVLENDNVLLFDNGLHAEGIHHPFSRVLEVNPETSQMVWNYRDEDNDNVIFYSCFMSGCQRLPNGNTLIAEANFGRIFEVTKRGETVWEYVNPEFTDLPEYGNNNIVPRAFKYDLDYSGLKGVKEIGLGKMIQTEADVARNKKAKEDRDKEAGQEENKEDPSTVMSRLEKLGY
ncbi:aryl-sulfate sulfotransferase [Verrucomicrobiota bacterium]